jgi:hypothetical protein
MAFQHAYPAATSPNLDDGSRGSGHEGGTAIVTLVGAVESFAVSAEPEENVLTGDSG